MGFADAFKRLLRRREKPGAAGTPVVEIKGPENESEYKTVRAALLRDLQSDNPKERLSALGVLINDMWSEDPGKEADAIRCIASVLKHPDMQMVHKAAGGLAEKGGIATLYMEKAALDPGMNQAARAAILSRSRMTVQAGYGHARMRDEVNSDGLKDEAGKVVDEALAECRYHGFSSHWTGRIHEGDHSYTYSLEIDLQRPEEMQVVISFGQKDCTPVKDKFCLPLVKVFAGGIPFKEISGIPTQRGLRYFGWPAPKARQ